MKATLQAGLSARASFEIDRDRTIDFMGEAARVYATPMLVRDIEMTCHNLLLEHLHPGEDSVGTRVEIDHIGATLLGMQVELSVRVAEVNGRAVVFEVEGRDAVEPIVRGRHARFVVDVAKTGQRPAALICTRSSGKAGRVMQRHSCSSRLRSGASQRAAACAVVRDFGSWWARPDRALRIPVPAGLKAGTHGGGRSTNPQRLGVRPPRWTTTISSPAGAGEDPIAG